MLADVMHMVRQDFLVLIYFSLHFLKLFPYTMHHIYFKCLIKKLLESQRLIRILIEMELFLDYIAIAIVNQLKQ